MDIRGDSTDELARRSPAITRRTCDPCRSRKVACDRSLPCASCKTYKVACTYSTVASRAKAPMQRVLLSSQYEQKIDAIAEDIDGIKAILQRLRNSGEEGKVSRTALSPRNINSTVHRPTIGTAPDHGEARWDHSGHILDFIKAVVNDGIIDGSNAEAAGLHSSLKQVIHVIENPTAPPNASPLAAFNYSAPPLEVILEVLRWSKEPGNSIKTPWIPQLLPRQQLTEICQKVYFSVEESSDIESILANGYLSYVFFEHVALSGHQDYLDYWLYCRAKAKHELSKLPLLLPASMENVAALALGSFLAIENSETGVAWTCVLAAASMCISLRYHHHSLPQTPESVAQETLFWTVYKLDKGLSSRLGRSSSLRDGEITLPFDPSNEAVMLGRVQGRVYDELFSVAGVSQSDEERWARANSLANEVRDVINQALMSAFTSQSPIAETSETTQSIYAQTYIVCQYSILTQILRAVPSSMTGNPIAGASDECVKAARDCLDLHEQCMAKIRGCASDPFIMKRYINWAILHTPFVPFNILFTRAVRLQDTAELARLDRFAASLQPDAGSESSTHPHRLYTLLCQAARLYFDRQSTLLRSPESLQGTLYDGGLDHFAPYGEGLSMDGNELSEWFFENQQMMSLLNDNILN